MEPEIESALSHLQEPGKSDVAGCAGDFVLSDNKEERGISEDLKPDVLLEAHSPGPDRGAAGHKTPHRKESSKKLTLITEDQKPRAEEKPYKCAECGKGFKGHARLLNHQQTHTREKLFECVECKKTFRRKANLVLHQRVHMGEKLYKCKECEKTFSHPSNLVAHCKTHAKKKASSCTICKKSFRGNAALFQHQKVHVNEKRYKCTECGNSFCLHSDFIKHQQIHLRETPSEGTAAANRSKFTSLHHKEEQRCGAGKHEMDHLNLLLEELKKMRENMDMLLLNQQSQLQVLQEIQKQLNILLPGNDLINSNVYSLRLLLARQAAAAGSLSFSLLNPSGLLCENAGVLPQSSAPEILPTAQLPVSEHPAASTGS